MIKLCVFDLDGTLIDSVPDLTNSINFALKQNKLPVRKREEIACNMGKGLTNLVKTAIPTEVFSEELLESLKAVVVDHYSSHCTDETTLYEGIFETLQQLALGGIKNAIITNKPHMFLDRIMKDLFSGLSFSRIIGAGEFPNKPDPASLYTLMNDTGVRNDECLYVGDTDIDIQTAINAGVISVGVSWGYQSAERLKNAGADYVINKPQELLEIVKSHD